MPVFQIIAAVIAIVASGVAYVESAKAAKEAKKSKDKLSGVLLNKNSNIEPIPVIYGTRRVGGVRVFVSTQDESGGDPNEFLYIALVLSEGEVESIESIEIDGYPITDERFNYTDSITINKHYGTDSQTVDTLLQEANTDWGSNHRLRGVAYLAVRLKYNPDAFTGIPEITAVVEGRKVYDPRSEETVFSANAALCIRDYLTNTRYGKGLPISVIDDDAFSTAADDCDESVTLYTDGDSGKIFECNMVLDTGATLFENLQKMLVGCRGFLPYRQGVYSLIIDKSASSVFTFTTDHIIDGIQVKGESKSDKANRYVVTFINPDANWQDDTAVWPEPGSSEETTYLAADGMLLSKELDLETVTNYYAAKDFARLFVLRSRNALRVAFKATSEAIQLTVADVVSITHPTPGWDAKKFQIEEIGLNDDGTCTVRAIEYDSSIYTYEPGAEHQAYPDTNLPNPFSVLAPTDLTIVETARVGPDLTVSSIITGSWTQPADAFVIQWEVQYKFATDSDYYSFVTTETTLENVGAAVGIQYDIRVRAINSFGVHSAWLTGSYTPQGTMAVIAATGLNPPTSAKMWFSPGEGQEKPKARINVEYSNTDSVFPEYLVVAYSYEDEPNQLAILTDAGSKLRLDPSNADTGIAGQFTLRAASGSTTTEIQYTDLSGIIDFDLSGQWWVSVSDGVDETRYHKVFESSATSIRLPPGEELSLTPSDGDTINVLELDWHDSRLPEFKLVSAGSEIIKHNGIDQDGTGYYLDVVERGAEGTSQADQSGLQVDYLPAFGPGTHTILIPFAQFEKIGSTYVYSDSVDLDMPSEFGWASASCYMATKASESDGVAFFRSNIVVFEYAGQY